MYSTPKLMSHKTTPSEKGITAQLSILNIKNDIGANKKTAVSALVGNVVSLANNFKPSARGCVRPIKPITLGPLRL